MKTAKYLIIGNGIAGLSCAKQLKKDDPNGSIIMLSEEAKEAYYRIKLTEYICDGYDIEKAYVNKPQWYEENNIELILNTSAHSLDTEKKEVTLQDGQVIKAEKILIATGASPFIPPIENIELDGIFALRTIEDLDSFVKYLEGKEKVTVLGGGLLGLEAAYSLLELGKKVNVVESFKYVLGRQLNEELGLRLNKELEDLGIGVYVGKNTKSFKGDKVLSHVILEDGTEIESDAVLISAGVRPNLGLLKDTNIQINKGIIVNNKLETNISGIYAAGDVVEIFDMVMGLWTVSMEMGKIVAKNMAGGQEVYEAPKLFTSLEIGEINIFSVGEVTNYDEIYKFDHEGNHHRIFVKDNVAVGGILDGDTKSKNMIKNFVFNQSAITELNSCGIPFEK